MLLEEIHRDMDQHPTVAPPHGSSDEDNLETYSSQHELKKFLPNSSGEILSSIKADSYQIVNQGNNKPRKSTLSSIQLHNIPESDHNGRKITAYSPTDSRKRDKAFNNNLVNAAAGNDMLLDDVVNDMATKGGSQVDYDEDEDEDDYEDEEPYDHRGREYDDDEDTHDYEYKDEDDHQYNGQPNHIGTGTNAAYKRSPPPVLKIGDKSPSDDLFDDMDADEYVDRNNGNPFASKISEMSPHQSSNLYEEDGDETTAKKNGTRGRAQSSLERVKLYEEGDSDTSDEILGKMETDGFIDGDYNELEYEDEYYDEDEDDL